jgi:urocanate hydratase
MALKIHDNGFVEIKTEKDALEALRRFRELKEGIDEIRRENDLDDMEKDAAAYKASAQNFMIQANLKHLQGDGWHGTLVESSGTSHWIETDDDLTENMRKDARSLQSIIEEKFKSSITEKGSKARKMWLKITKRVLDPDAIEEQVNEGKLKVDEISPAWYETSRAPYLRIFEDD